MLPSYIATNDQDEEINDEAVIVTATIKVKDSPGALWEAIYTIGVSVQSLPQLDYKLVFHDDYALKNALRSRCLSVIIQVAINYTNYRCE